MNSLRAPLIGTHVSLSLQVQDLIDDNAEMRTNRRISIGMVVSVLFHIALLLFLYREQIDGVAPPSAQGPLVVHLNPASPPPAAEPAAPPAKPAKRVPPQDNVIAVNRAYPTPQSIPVPPREEIPPDPNAPPVDMMAMVNASRSRRQAIENAAARENSEARNSERGPNENDIREANIKRNLQTLTASREGTNGVFQIVSKGTRTAQFSFRGWTSSERSSKYQLIEVDAGLHGNVELAIVRRMIDIIRTHYKGNFNWESQRLHRVVVQSARLEDTAGLEEFLMQEFFSNVG